MNDGRARHDEQRLSPHASRARAEVLAMAARMRRAQEEVNERVMLAKAQCSEAVERRIVAEDSLARAELSRTHEQGH